VRLETVNLTQGELRMHNRYQRCSLAHLELDWRQEVDGLPCQAGTRSPLAILPGKHDETRIPFASGRMPAGSESWLTLRFCHAAATRSPGRRSGSPGRHPNPAPPCRRQVRSWRQVTTAKSCARTPVARRRTAVTL